MGASRFGKTVCNTKGYTLLVGFCHCSSTMALVLIQTLRIIKAAQRLGFTLEEVSDLLEVGRRRGRDTGLQARAGAKLAEVQARMADLEAIRTNLVAAIDAGCETSTSAPQATAAPLPFMEIATRREDV